MGCDIHITIEVNNDGKWTRVPYVVAPYRELEEGDEHSYLAARHRKAEEARAAGIAVMPDVFDNRNYDLFGILADVRNGRGFAGVKTGDAWPSIAPNRGVPKDAEAVAVDESGDGPRSHDDGEHSHTWVSLDELTNFGWDTVAASQRGIVAWEEWKRWRAAGEKRPKSWSQGVWGHGISTFNEEHALNVLESLKAMEASGATFLLPQVDKVYVECFWGETAREATDNWAGEVIPLLTQIAAGRPLRLILSFDS